MLEKVFWIWRYYRRHLYVLAVLILLTPVQAAFQVAIPRMFGFAVDYLETGKEPQGELAGLALDAGKRFALTPTAAFGLGFILLGLIATVLYAFVQSHRAWMNTRLEWSFRQGAFDNATTKGPDFFNRFRTGDLVTRMTDDVAEKLSWFACSGIFRLYEALLYVGFILFMMMMIDKRLTLWTAGPLPLLIGMFIVFSSALDRRYDRLQTRISRLYDIMEACFSGIRIVMAYVREQAQKAVFHKAAQDRRRAEISVVKITTVMESMWMYLWQFALIIVLVAGGNKVINSQLSHGSLAVFIYYVVWLVFPMFNIGQFLVKSRQSAVSIDRLVELEKVPSMVEDRGGIDLTGSVEAGLSYNNVSFTFDGAGRNILEDVSFTVDPGRTVALVGRIGSGKTWLINMLPRLVDPTSGTITLDGRDLRSYGLAQLRRIIGYVPQEPVLFSDTVRSNVLFGRKEIDESTLNWALEVSQLKQEVEGFPKGLDTPIGTRGMSISGGQKQRLALARALAGRPRILILDDCTSALDSSTESALWAQLHEVLPGTTALVITHRPDTLERSDAIIVLEEGRVVESGNHQDLMARGETYASIYTRYRLEEQVGANRLAGTAQM